MAVQLTWKTIGDLGRGSAGLLIDRAIADAIHDLDDRGGEDAKARKVNIDVIFEPRADGDAEVSVEVKLDLPKFKTPSHVCGRTRADGELALQFEAVTPERADQRTLPIIKDE